MLAYPINEAEELLESKLNAAKTSLANCEEDLDFLREQVTVSFTAIYLLRRCLANVYALQTMEVAVARVYNWDVVQKRKDKEEEEKAEKGSKGKENDTPNG